MKRSRFTEQQIAFFLQQAEQGTQVAEVARKMGISEQTFPRWKKKFGGLTPSEVRKLRHQSRLIKLHRQAEKEGEVALHLGELIGLARGGRTGNDF